MKDYIPHIFFLVGLLTGTAQDSHYWSQQFGSRSTLTSGSLVAGASDVSMLYYNPGSIGKIENSSITISSNLYRNENIQITNALGDRGDFKSNHFASIPLMAGGLLPIKGKVKVAYGIMSPVNFDFKGIARLDDNLPIVDNAESPGEEEIIATTSLNARVTETVFAAGFGYPVSEKLFLGASLLIPFRHQTYSSGLLTRMYLNDPDETFVNTSAVENVKYWNVRTAIKAGLSYVNEAWTYGFTITSPSLNIMGNGVSNLDIAANNYRTTSGQRIDVLASDRQEKLKSTFKSPFSVSAGVKYRKEKTMVALAVQYFGAVDIYEVLSAEPASFVRPADQFPDFSSDRFLNVYAGAKPVFNVALGYERQLNEKNTLNLGFRTDMSYYDDDLNDLVGLNPVITSWNLFHLVVGATYQANQHTLSYGGLLSFGKKDDYQQRNAVTGGDLAESDFLRGKTAIAEARYVSIGLMLGYTYDFK